jgi:glycine dehydrogenase subunit 1
VVHCPVTVSKINEPLLEEGIIGGLDLSLVYPEYKNQMLVAVTEKNSKELIDLFCEKLQEAVNE